MFERVIIDNNVYLGHPEIGGKLDQVLTPGLLAEKIIFYGTVDLWTTAGPLNLILKNIDKSIIEDLVVEGILRIHVDEWSSIWMRTERLYDGYVSVEERKCGYYSGGEHFKEALSMNKDFSSRTLDLIDFGPSCAIEEFNRYKQLYPVLTAITDLEITDSLVKTFFAKNNWKLYSEDFYFQVEWPNQKEFVDLITKEQMLSDGNRSSIPIKLIVCTNIPDCPFNNGLHHDLLRTFINMLCALCHSADTQSDTEILSPLSPLTEGIFATLNRRTSFRQIELFQETILSEYKPIRDAVNCKELSFDSIAKIVNLEEHKRFRSWLNGLPAEKNLVEEYFNQISRLPLIANLPSKGIRFTFLTALGLTLDALGAGGFGTATGITLGAFDQFLIERLGKGWRPNAFIDKHYKAALPPRLKE
jgi:hypothetical protein